MAAHIFSSKDSDDDAVDHFSASRSAMNSTRTNGASRRAGGKDVDEMLSILIRHHSGDQRQLQNQHMGTTVGDIKAMYLDAVSKLPASQQSFLISDFNSAHLRASGAMSGALSGTGEGFLASAARRLGAGQLSAAPMSAMSSAAGGASSASLVSALGGGSALPASATHGGITSTRFSGVLGKSFNFKNIIPADLTFATRSGHILRDGERIAPLRRADTGIVEIFVVPPVPHRAQEPLAVVSALFPLPNSNEVECHITVRDYDFAAAIASAERQQQQPAAVLSPVSAAAVALAADNSPGGNDSKETSSANPSQPPSPFRATPASAWNAPRRRPEPLVVREVQIPPPPLLHHIAPHVSSASAANAGQDGGGDNSNNNNNSNVSERMKSGGSGLPLPTARDLSRMSIATQQTAAAATCGDFIVHVHPEHATVIEGASNPNYCYNGAAAFLSPTTAAAAASSSSPSPPVQPPIVLNATSTQRKRAVPVSEFSCRINALYGRTDTASPNPPQHQQQQQQQGKGLSKISSDVSILSSGKQNNYFGNDIAPIDRAVSYYSAAWWSPVHAYTAPDGNFIIVHLVPKVEATNSTPFAAAQQFPSASSSTAADSSSCSTLQRSNSITAFFDPASKTGHFNSSLGTQQQQHTAAAFLIFESASRGSSWICRGAVRLPHVDTALSGWANETRFVICVGSTHCVIKVEHEGPIQVRCTTLHLNQQQSLPGAASAETAPHFENVAGFAAAASAAGSGQRQHRRVTTLQLIRVLPEYSDETLMWFDTATQILRIAHGSPLSNFSGMAVHFKRRHANPLLFGYVLQSRQPKWQLQSSALPQFVISSGESGYNGISMEEASQCNNSNPTPQPAAAAPSSLPKNISASCKASNASLALSSVSMATITPATVTGPGNLTQQIASSSFNFSSASFNTFPQQQSSTASNNTAAATSAIAGGSSRPQPQAVYFLHQLHAAQTAPHPPDEALLLHFPQQLVYVSEHHGREEIFRTAIVTPKIQPGSIVAAHYFNLNAPSNSSGGNNNNNNNSSSGSSPQQQQQQQQNASAGKLTIPSRLRLIYVSDNAEDRSTTIHIVTLQAEWKAPAVTEDGILNFFKRKLSFFSRSSSNSNSGGGSSTSGASGSSGGSGDEGKPDDAATQAKAKEAELLAIQSHKSLKLSGMEAFQHGACDCYMASAAPVGVVVKATGSVGGVAAVRLRAVGER